MRWKPPPAPRPRAGPGQGEGVYHRGGGGAEPPVRILELGLRTWSRIHGPLSLEIEGIFEEMGLDGPSSTKPKSTTSWPLSSGRPRRPAACSRVFGRSTRDPRFALRWSKGGRRLSFRVDPGSPRTRRQCPRRTRRRIPRRQPRDTATPRKRQPPSWSWVTGLQRSSRRATATLRK
jgi:hypothetical protein